MNLQKEYNLKQEEIRHLLLQLMDKIDNHKISQKEHSNNWGYFGELEFVAEKLNEINNFLK